VEIPTTARRPWSSLFILFAKCELLGGGGDYVHCNENPIYVFLFWELRGLSPNFHIHVSVSDLYSPRIGPHFWLLQNRQTVNLSQIYECWIWETEHYNSVLEIRRRPLLLYLWPH
jgi:hypothetical protein